MFLPSSLCHTCSGGSQGNCWRRSSSQEEVLCPTNPSWNPSSKFELSTCWLCDLEQVTATNSLRAVPGRHGDSERVGNLVKVTQGAAEARFEPRAPAASLCLIDPEFELACETCIKRKRIKQGRGRRPQGWIHFRLTGILHNWIGLTKLMPMYGASEFAFKPM